MIRNTFSILHGIGVKLERKLWQKGILTWPDFLHSSDLDFIASQRKNFFDECLFSALRELENENAQYFAAAIKKREHWRLFDIFKGESACLDIETNGFMPWSGGYVTVVGLYDGHEYKCFVKDVNLNCEDLKQELSRYKYLITFYGAGFDIPFLKRSMPGLPFTMPHFDVCFGARKLGLKGGLKKLEVELGMERNESIRNLDGYDAVKLWEQAQRGSSEALETLKCYNRADTVNLFTLAHFVYNNLRVQTGIEEYL